MLHCRAPIWMDCEKVIGLISEKLASSQINNINKIRCQVNLIVMLDVCFMAHSQ